MCHSFVSCFMQLTSNALVLQAKANIISHTMYRICNYNRDGVFFSLSRGRVISHAISVSKFLNSFSFIGQLVHSSS